MCWCILNKNSNAKVVLTIVFYSLCSNNLHTFHTMARQSSSAVATEATTIACNDNNNKRKKNKIKSKSSNNTKIIDKINKRKGAKLQIITMTIIP